ncbi:MAG: hypothetical protein ACI4E1_01855 [Lachnospira sp.]
MKKTCFLQGLVLLLMMIFLSGCSVSKEKNETTVSSLETETEAALETPAETSTEQETFFSESETEEHRIYESMQEYETQKFNGKNYSSAWNGTEWVTREQCEALSDDEIDAVFQQLRKDFPEGKYWNNGGISDEPCEHESPDTRYCNKYEGVTNTAFSHYKWYELGTQCLGFASLISDCIFGADAPVNSFTDFNQVRVGDHVRMNNDTHSAIVIEKGNDYIVVVECNADYKTCQITWGRKITEETLNATNSWYITRYF